MPQGGEVPCSSSQSEHDSLEFNLRFLYALNPCIFSAYLLGAFEAMSGPVASMWPWNQQRIIFMKPVTQHGERPRW